MNKLLLVTSLCLAPALVAEAGSPAPSAAPHDAVLSGAKAIRRNDVSGFLKSAFGKAQIDEMRKQWDMKRKTPPTEQEEMQFRQTMAMLTGPGAEEQIMAMIEPKLAEMKPQMAMMVGMFTGMAQAALEQNEQLNSEEKQQSKRVLEAISSWAQQADFTSPERARKAVGIICSSARRLNLTSMKDLQGMRFEQLLAKGGVAVKATKDLLVVYGMSVDKWLDSIEAETVEQEGDTAVVRVTYEILGVRQSSDAQMVRVDGIWLRKDLIEQKASVSPYGR